VSGVERVVVAQRRGRRGVAVPLGDVDRLGPAV